MGREVSSLPSWGNVETGRNPRQECVLAGGNRHRDRQGGIRSHGCHRHGRGVAGVLGDPGNAAKREARRVRIQFRLMPRIGDRGLAGLVERFRGVGVQEFQVPDVGRAGSDQTIKNLADLGDLADRHTDLVGDAIAG